MAHIANVLPMGVSAAKWVIINKETWKSHWEYVWVSVCASIKLDLLSNLSSQTQNGPLGDLRVFKFGPLTGVPVKDKVI